MALITCNCTPAPAPFDHLFEVNRRCLIHRFRTEEEHLVAAGWYRAGPSWMHPTGTLLCSQDEAYGILLAEERKEQS